LRATLRTGDCHFDPLFDAGGLGRGDRSKSFVLSVFAGFAAFGLVPQALVVEKHLFPNGPDKLFAAIDAGYGPILIVRCLFDVNLLFVHV